MPHRRTLVALLAPLALCLAAPLARAAETARLTATFSPYALGQPATLESSLTIASSTGGIPSPMTAFSTRMPANMEFVGSALGLAICQPAALEAHGPSGCSPNARIGVGSAHAEVAVGPRILGETITVEAFMGPEAAGGNSELLLNGQAQSPVISEMFVPAALGAGSGSLGDSVNATLPLTQGVLGGAYVSVTSVRMSLGPAHLTYYKMVHGKSVGYRPRGIVLPESCPRGGFVFVANLTFLDGTALRVPTSIPCPSQTKKAPPRHGTGLAG